MLPSSLPAQPFSTGVVLAQAQRARNSPSPGGSSPTKSIHRTKNPPQALLWGLWEVFWSQQL